MDRAGCIQFFSAEFGKHHKNCFSVGRTALNECSLLHSRQLMREAALVPTHHRGQCLLAHLAFAKAGESRQHTKLRTGESRLLCDIPPNTTEHIFSHKQEGMPDPKFLRR